MDGELGTLFKTNDKSSQGKWSDAHILKDRSLSSREKESLATGEGEWWMDYEDFAKCFTHLTICHPEPEPATLNALKVAWREASFEVGAIKCFAWFSTDSVLREAGT